MKMVVWFLELMKHQ